MFLIRALTRKNGVRILIIDNTGPITAKTREYKNLKIKNLLAYNLAFKPPINKNLFSPENEKQVLIFQNHISEMQLQSSARILFGELGTWHCCRILKLRNTLITILFSRLFFFFLIFFFTEIRCYF